MAVHAGVKITSLNIICIRLYHKSYTEIYIISNQCKKTLNI